MIFQYGAKELSHLRQADPPMGRLIDRYGRLEREVIPDLYAALSYSIVGQQISTKAQRTVWQRLNDIVGDVTPERVAALPPESLQQAGISFRKVGYICSAARKVLSGEFDLHTLERLSDHEVCVRLTALDGVGVWTAEMLMIFSMQRPDILSFNDLGILRGLRMLYGLPTVERADFERIRCRYSPYGSVASLYLWTLAGDPTAASDFPQGR